jgi:hypothetical protein
MLALADDAALARLGDRRLAQRLHVYRLEFSDRAVVGMLSDDGNACCC